MRGRLGAIVALGLGPLLGLACDKTSAPPREEVPTFLFDARRPWDREIEAFKKAGGDPDKALRPQGVADLARLEVGKLYAYVVLPDSVLVLAPTPAGSTPEWTHPVLARGGTVMVAGFLRTERQGDKLTKVYVDASSDAYCPTSEALRTTLVKLDALKVPRDLLRVDHRPAVDCLVAPVSPSASQKGPKVSFGTVMSGVARRFELVGKAVVARRFELAAYAAEEIGETFQDELSAASPPPLPEGVSLGPFTKLVIERDVPELAKAIVTRDEKAIEKAFVTLSTTCNACHTAAGRPFIEVPTKLGESAPRLEPK
jgi:hypothetical protein